MTPDDATSSSPAPQAAAPGSQSAQPAPASPASQPTPVQLLWDVATLALTLLARIVNVIQPIQQYYLAQSRQVARLLIDIPRILLTIRFAPERVTQAQLRHLTRARHILQALFNYTLPLGPRTSSSVNQYPSASTQNATSLGARTSRPPYPTANQSPSAFTNNATSLGARTPSSATTLSPAVSATPSPNAPSSTTPGVRTPTIRQVPEIPIVAGVSQVPASPTADRNPLPPSPSPASQSPHSAFPDPQSVKPQSAIHNPQSPFSPFIPDFHTLAQALKSDTLPPNCAGALFEDPGDALVRALHQLHAVYFFLYPNQSPTRSPSPSQSSVNLQSSIGNPQSGTPQSDASSVHPVHPVHSPSPSQSSSSVNLQSSIFNLQSDIPHSEFRIPHSSSPP